MGFTVDAKHVLLCGLVALLLTYAAFHDKFPHGDAVSVQGRKGLTDPQLTPSLDATEDDVTVEAEETSTQGVAQSEETREFSAQTEENGEFSAQEDSSDEELPAVREMEETDPGTGTGTPVTTPDPEYNANPFLQQINQNNAEAAKKEDVIQTCILIDGCGTPP